jgi:hypothetical protein
MSFLRSYSWPGWANRSKVAANTKLREAVHSPVLGAFLSFVIGAAVLLMLVFSGLVGGQGQPAGAAAAPANLERLRSRDVGAKRSLALRGFALGIEALE